MIKFTLDCSIWICGQPTTNKLNRDNPNCLGKGYTALLNDKGFMCCLGQFAMQMGVDKDKLFDKSVPHQVMSGNTVLTGDYDGYRNSRFSTDAMFINDDTNTSVDEKIEKLSELCKANDIELTVINRPKAVKI